MYIYTKIPQRHSLWSLSDLWSLSVTISCNVLWRINYSDMDEGINPNPFVNERYGCWLHIKTILGSWSPSQESGTSSKVRKGSWFFSKFFFHFLDVSRRFGGFVIFFFSKKFSGTKFSKSDWQNFGNFWEKNWIFFFYIFQCFWIFWVVWELFGGREGAKPPLEAKGHHKNKRPEGPRCSCMSIWH